jgi:hypothetical protein
LPISGFLLRSLKYIDSTECLPENLITLLASHAGRADPVMGYRLSPQEDPLLVPMLYALPAGPAWLWLTPDGKRTTVPPDGAS